MAKRMNGGPMDFRWQQGHGPALPDSPFFKPISQDEHKDGLASCKSSHSLYQLRSPKIPALSPPHNHPSVSSSPKEKPLTPHQSSSFMMPHGPKEVPLIPHQNSTFMTPHRSNESGHSSDSNIQSSLCISDTSQFPSVRDVAQLDSTLVRSKETDVGEGSDGFSTLEHTKSSRTFYSDTVPRRVYKRRRREADRHVCLLPYQDITSKPDSDALPQSNQHKINALHEKAPSPQAQAPGLISSVFTYVENHPNLPHILSYYTQFLLNLFIVFFMMYLVYSFWSTIRSDVDLRFREVVSVTIAEIAVCAREFRENRCERSMRVPAMEITCNFWEKCVNQDPDKVARAMVSANTFAEILNNFFEPITAKTMIVSFILIFGCFAISNGTLIFFRRKIPTHSSLPLEAYNMQPLAQVYPHPQQIYPDHHLTPNQRNLQEVLWRRRAVVAGQGLIEMETPARRLEYY